MFRKLNLIFLFYPNYKKKYIITTYITLRVSSFHHLHLQYVYIIYRYIYIYTMNSSKKKGSSYVIVSLLKKNYPYIHNGLKIEKKVQWKMWVYEWLQFIIYKYICTIYTYCKCKWWKLLTLRIIVVKIIYFFILWLYYNKNIKFTSPLCYHIRNIENSKYLTKWKANRHDPGAVLAKVGVRVSVWRESLFFSVRLPFGSHRIYFNHHGDTLFFY